MKKILLLLLLTVQTVSGQSIVGSWLGELIGPGVKIPLVLNISEKEGVLRTTLDSPSQSQKGLATKETKFENNELNIDATPLGITYKGKLNEEGVIVGTFFQGGRSAPLNFTRIEPKVEENRKQTPVPPYNYYTEEVEFKNETEGNLLAGTISAPNQSKDYPVFVMITGSGSQNRDSEIAGHKPFLVIADYLAKNEIGTLRLDDRGVGGSEKGKPEATSADLAGDINSAVNFLADKGYTKIGLIGHSEGGMIAPMVAEGNSKVKFLVLMAGPGIAISEMMPIQMSNLYKGMGFTETMLKQITEGYTKFFGEMKSNYAPISGEAIKDKLEHVHDGLNPDLKKSLISPMVLTFSSDWGRYFISFEPDVYLSKLKIPVLAINGSYDMNVPSKVNLEGMNKSLKKE
jgi:pimeloyl-ACP methyl ester carboxylesterase